MDIRTWKEKIWNWIKPKLKQPPFYMLCLCAAVYAGLLFCALWTQLFSISTAILITWLFLFVIAICYYFFFVHDEFLTKILAWLVCALFCLVSVFQANTFISVHNTFETMAFRPSKVEEIWGIYSYQQAPIGEETDLDDLTLGVLESRMDTAREILDGEEINARLKGFPSIQSLYKALKGQAVRAIVMEPGTASLLSQTIGKNAHGQGISLTRKMIIDSGEVIENADNDPETQPFSVLLTVSHSPLSEYDYRTALVNLITVNPLTREVLVTALPRSLQVQLACPEGLHCAAEEEKLALTSLYSQFTIENTVSELLSCQVQYGVRVSLPALNALIDQRGGLDIENEEEFSSGSYNFKSGEISLNSASANAYSGGFDDYSTTDSQYEKHTGMILNALLEKTGGRNLTAIKTNSSQLEQTVETTMSYSQLVTLYKMFFMEPWSWNISYQTLQSEGSFGNSSILGTSAWMEIPDSASLKACRKAIYAVLDGKTPVTEQVDNKDIEEKETSDSDSTDQSDVYNDSDQIEDSSEDETEFVEESEEESEEEY